MTEKPRRVGGLVLVEIEEPKKEVRKAPISRCLMSRAARREVDTRLSRFMTTDRNLRNTLRGHSHC
jgi:hypothetical protein